MQVQICMQLLASHQKTLVRGRGGSRAVKAHGQLGRARDRPAGRASPAGGLRARQDRRRARSAMELLPGVGDVADHSMCRAGTTCTRPAMSRRPLRRTLHEQAQLLHPLLWRRRAKSSWHLPIASFAGARGGLASPAKSQSCRTAAVLDLGQVVGDLREGVTIGRVVTDPGDRRLRH